MYFYTRSSRHAVVFGLVLIPLLARQTTKKMPKLNVVAYCDGAACDRPNEDAEQQTWHGQDCVEYHRSVLLCWSTVSLAWNLTLTLTSDPSVTMYCRRRTPDLLEFLVWDLNHNTNYELTYVGAIVLCTGTAYILTFTPLIRSNMSIYTCQIPSVLKKWIAIRYNGVINSMCLITPWANDR